MYFSSLQRKKKKNELQKKLQEILKFNIGNCHFLQCLQNFLNALQKFLQCLQISPVPLCTLKHTNLFLAQGVPQPLPTHCALPQEH